MPEPTPVGLAARQPRRMCGREDCDELYGSLRCGRCRGPALRLGPGTRNRAALPPPLAFLEVWQLARWQTELRPLLLHQERWRRADAAAAHITGHQVGCACGDCLRFRSAVMELARRYVQ